MVEEYSNLLALDCSIRGGHPKARIDPARQNRSIPTWDKLVG